MRSQYPCNHYLRCVSDNFQIFNNFAPNNPCGVHIWNSILSACATFGKGADSLKLFNDMWQSGVEPDPYTFANVFTACNHAGLIDDIVSLYFKMESKYGVVPVTSHQTNIVDAFSRKESVDKALEFIHYEIFSHDIATWTSVLRGCRASNNVELATYAAQRALQIDPYCTSVYALLGNVYHLFAVNCVRVW